MKFITFEEKPSAKEYLRLVSNNTDVFINEWKPNTNGHEYVDLGLPSGTLWATMNIGATNDKAKGKYFAWGEKREYSSSNTYSLSSKYTGTTDLVLDLEDDTARNIWGGDWQMPTKEQVKELFDNTSFTKNASGATITSNIKGYEGKSIYFPNTGCYRGSWGFQESTTAYFWTASRWSKDNKGEATDAYINSYGRSTQAYSKSYGYPVRAVIIDPTKKK